MSKTKIALVDDANFIKDMIVELLGTDQYEFLSASSGEEILAQYQEWKPDIIFLDYLMSSMDGKEVVLKLKEMDAGVKVVICSAMAGQEWLAKELCEVGVITCVKKPFGKEDLLEAIALCGL